ncbi:hypothetical protein JR316_0006476 [Psilocybe cubensis]|uniref:Retrotransposon Copia-like N-terminal domain-containing protein n=2 Tax=Psilocybe cubensis TaxID=181762 RepID=A0A8H7XNB4_PSICU|nr:hypothetical protein JR316_0006476 [Psilocybe cubensis]KAH9481946.1 hypothetical protein JR316_0006476 [Psilocybe cubensis]
MDKQDDYPHVCFWDKEEWIDYKTRAANHNQSVDKLYFLCNKDGKMVSQARREEMTETPKVAFNELYYWRLDPHTWGKGNQQAWDYFSTIMRGKFPEFRWCSNNWKIREFATIRYPNWASHIHKTGDLLRARPSIGKRGTNYNNLTASKPKKRRPNTSLHSHTGEQHIIDVDAVPLPKEVPVLGPSILPNPEFASDLPHRQESPTVEEISSATAASILTRTSVELVTTLTSNSTNLCTLEDSEVPIVNAEKHTDRLASSTTSDLSGTSERAAFQRVEDVELTVPNRVQQNAISTCRTRLNPLAGLTIPNPASEVPGQSALENTSNSKSSMVPVGVHLSLLNMAAALTGGSSAIKIGNIELLVGASNYNAWRRGMTMFLRTNNLWGYIEGNLRAPNPRHHNAQQLAPHVPLQGATNAQEDAYNAWSFNDMKARSLIEHRISPVSLSLLPYEKYKTAREVWAAIKLLYARQDTASQFLIKDRLHSLKLKDHNNLDNYISEFQRG